MLPSPDDADQDGGAQTTPQEPQAGSTQPSGAVSAQDAQENDPHADRRAEGRGSPPAHAGGHAAVRPSRREGTDSSQDGVAGDLPLDEANREVVAGAGRHKPTTTCSSAVVSAGSLPRFACTSSRQHASSARCSETTVLPCSSSLSR